MSNPQPTASPRGPRAKHQHSKSATQAPPASVGRNPQRRPRGNRANNANNGINQNNQRNPADVAHLKSPGDTQNPHLSDSAALSGEDLHLSSGSRTAKKHTHSQHASERVLSPKGVQTASLTDSETGPNNPSATPAKAQGAYAGPTFHASPAPSALPMPKFLSKSVPAKTRVGPPTPPDEGSDSASPSSPSPPSPSRAPIPVPPRQENSPLDMLFKADRAERARNATHSPTAIPFSNSPDPFSNGTPHHSKHGSQGSLNAVFPIELDAAAQNPHRSPPATVHRSNTAPSKIPQAEEVPASNNESAAIQDLFDRLSMSQKKPPADAAIASTTPPKTGDRVPSEPNSRFHTPSPFNRSNSGPTTPAPAPVNQEQQPNFFYGNRNLSPLFKAAAKPDGTPRNSGLRTEITADSPLMGQGEFPVMPMAGPVQFPAPAPSSQQYMNQAFGPASPRRGSAPQVQPYNDTHNHNQHRKPRTPGRNNQYRPRPDSHPHNQHQQNGANNTKPVSVPKSNPFVPSSVQAASVPKSNPFVPSSVKAKQYPSQSPPPTSKVPDSLSLEQDLKRLLNVKMGDTAGVR